MRSGLDVVRSVLFLPASNPRAIGHARESAADLVVLDLEDAVKPEDKDAARKAAVEAVAGQWPMPVAIRINAIGPPAALKERAPTDIGSPATASTASA